MSSNYKYFLKDKYLSQWSESSFSPLDVPFTFNCMKQYMMWAKARLFHDELSIIKILKSRDPIEQKQIGRNVKNFDQAKWDVVKLYIVTQGNLLKFTQNVEHWAYLRATGDSILVGANPYDSIWGIGYSAKDAPNYFMNWGQNLLGKALMTVRELIR